MHPVNMGPYFHYSTTAIATSVPSKKGKTKRSLVLDGDYHFVVARFKDQFLRECTQKLSRNGARDVQCVEARSGSSSIVVDVSGSKAAVDAAVAEVNGNGLELPSFATLIVPGVCVMQCMFRLFACSLDFGTYRDRGDVEAHYHIRACKERQNH